MSLGRNPEVGSSNRIHENCSHGDEQQTCEAEDWGLLQHN